MNKNVLKELQPKKVFEFFEEICNIPHGSGNVSKISDYLVDFAKKRNLYYRQDDSLNVVIKKPGIGGQTVIIQGHMDMVAVKTEDSNKNLESEGLDIYIQDGYITADRTTLGADDGIALAYALAILDSTDIEHPPIEAVFTVDEEIGMLGADSFEPVDIEGKLLINIDSDEEGIFTVGCAGGARINAHFDMETTNKTGNIVDISISGLTSGHSGVDIIYQRANANVLMGRLLMCIDNCTGLNIINLCGGEKDNSIAPFSKAKLLIEDAFNIDELKNVMDKCIANIKSEYYVTDPNMAIEYRINPEEKNVLCFDNSSSNRVVLSFMLIPDGVIKMSNDVKGLVQTSVNLGIVKVEGNTLTESFLARSSVESEKEYLIGKIVNTVELLSGDCELEGVYPAWEYKRDSFLRNIFCDSYKKICGKDPEVLTIHAGVECGVFTSKIEGLDCISFGPQMSDIHTVNEKLCIESVETNWKLLLEVLKALSTYCG